MSAPFRQSSERRFEETRLLVIHGEKTPALTKFPALSEQLGPNDLLVLNSSGTIPASLEVGKGTMRFELRLAAFAGENAQDLSRWHAVAFGAGTWHDATEARGAPPPLAAGDLLEGSGFRLEVERVVQDRLLLVRFLGENFLEQVYSAGRPVQYSYQVEDLPLWSVQTPLAGIPLSVEAPSALFPFRWETLLALRRRFRVAYLLHGAGLSSTGSPALDALLPLPEYYEIPEATVRAWRETRAAGGRVIAVGTSVARALESARQLAYGEPRLLSGTTRLRVREGCTMDRVDGLLTGFHEPLTSHFDLEAAFVGGSALRTAYAQGKAAGFRSHEFGDAALLIT